MLTARVQLKLDDEYPQITEALLERLFPEFLAPLPSLTLLEFELDAGRREATTALAVPASLAAAHAARGRRALLLPQLLRRRAVADRRAGRRADQLRRGEPHCPPEATAALRIQLGTLGSQTFADLPIDRLRFHLDGESGLSHALYELLFRDPRGLLLRVPGKPETTVALPPGALSPAASQPDESLLARAAAPSARCGSCRNSSGSPRSSSSPTWRAWTPRAAS